ncbi:hypothetical protein DSO57_1002961 [Entomophthora muscae]|uniref:Uncharacterized protein n=1 Tax=Entomophthora muscae TaxID=34485 RepID=A0ACC2U7Q8_9FUNG|nr:hypothetical protein DSO57_1002961 [Entomophthora muscae]
MLRTLRWERCCSSLGKMESFTLLSSTPKSSWTGSATIMSTKRNYMPLYAPWTTGEDIYREVNTQSTFAQTIKTSYNSQKNTSCREDLDDPDTSYHAHNIQQVLEPSQFLNLIATASLYTNLNKEIQEEQLLNPSTSTTNLEIRNNI